MSYQVLVFASAQHQKALKDIFISFFNGLKDVSWEFFDKEINSEADLKIIIDEKIQKIVFQGQKIPDISMPCRLGILFDSISMWYEAVQSQKQTIFVGPYHFIFKTRSLYDLDKKTAISLTEKEAELLQFMVQKTDHCVTREDLLEHVWAYAEGVDTHTIETHIYRLRQKIEKTIEPKILVTQDQGYVLSVSFVDE